MATQFSPIPESIDIQELLDEEARLREVLKRQRPSGEPNQSGKYLTFNFDRLKDSLLRKQAEEKLGTIQRKKLDVQGKYQEEMVRQLRQFREKENGKTVEVPGPTLDGGPAERQVPGDQRAYREFLDSPYPAVAAAAKNSQGEYDKRFAEAAKKSTVGSLAESGGDLGKLVEPDQYTHHDGVMYQGKPGQMPQVVQPIRQEKGSDGVMYNVYPSGLRKPVDTTPKTNVNVGGEKADTEFLKSEGKALSESRVKIEGGFQGSLRALQSAENAVRSGAFQGPLAGAVQVGVGVMQQLGIAPEAWAGKLTRTEEVTSAMGKAVLENVKALGSGTAISNADRVYAQEVAGGKQLTPEGLLRLINVARMDLLNTQQGHNNRADVLSEKLPSAGMAKIERPEGVILPDEIMDPGVMVQLSPGRIAMAGAGLDPQTGMLMPKALRAKAKEVAPAKGKGPSLAERNRARAAYGLPPVSE